MHSFGGNPARVFLIMVGDWSVVAQVLHAHVYNDIERCTLCTVDGTEYPFHSPLFDFLKMKMKISYYSYCNDTPSHRNIQQRHVLF